jgi:O-6-methylguanine DNA methyltransferase
LKLQVISTYYINQDEGVLTMEKVCYAGIETSMGIVWAATTEKGLVQVHTSGKKDLFMFELRRRIKGEFIQDPSKFEKLRKQLELWNIGKPITFDIPLDLRGTQFQKRVWLAIHNIPYGKLSSYGRIAKAIGNPRSARAVGNAVGSNPCGIVIPCHRVIWSNGGLGGFRGGYDKKDLDEKRRLLAKEGILPKKDDYPEKGLDLAKFFT